MGAGNAREPFSIEFGAGDGAKKLGRLELGLGEDCRGDRWTEASYEYSIGQSLRPGELGDRGNIAPGDVAETGSVERSKFVCLFERLSQGVMHNEVRESNS